MNRRCSAFAACNSYCHRNSGLTLRVCPCLSLSPSSSARYATGWPFLSGIWWTVPIFAHGCYNAWRWGRSNRASAPAKSR